MQVDYTFQNRTFQPGQRGMVTIPVTRMANGLIMELTVHVIHGKNPGPKLFLCAASHGDAFWSVDIVGRILEQIDPQLLSGTILAVSCANPAGFEWESRNSPQDMNNMNRAYPGKAKGWFTEQMAAALSPLCREADYLIDWHGGNFAKSIHYCLMEQIPADAPAGLKETIHKMASAYGVTYYYGGAPDGPAAAYAGTLSEYMIALGKPAIVAECGGDMPLPEDIFSESVEGGLNVMRHLGMYPGDIRRPKKQYLFHKRPLVRATQGGIFCPVCDYHYAGRTVPKGTKIAEVRDPLTFDVVEEIYNPCEEGAFLSIRGFPSIVHPGSYAYIIGEMAGATVWESE